MDKLDALVIGGGHNGLTCAAYLARAGLSVRVLERRPVVGGAAVTEEFHPGFRNSVAAYALSLLDPKIIRELELARHGLVVVERRAQNFLPTPDGSHLLTGPGRTRQSIARLNRHDGDRYDAYAAELGRIADVLRALALQPPPNVVSGWGRRGLSELLRAARLGNRLRRLDMPDRRALLDLFAKSAADYLEGWFQSEPVQALFAFDAVVGNYASPYTPGTAYVLLHHAFGEVNGRKGAWGHAIGGMGAVSESLARAARSHGAGIETGAEVREILVENGRAIGATLADGRTLRAPLVAANVNPRLLYGALVPASALPAGFARRMARWKCGSGTFRMNVALSELPSFTALPGRTVQDHHTSGIILAPSLAYMDRAWLDARTLGWSREPVVELLIPSTLDQSLAPPGGHVASLFCQHVAPVLPDGSSWDAHREAVADLMIDTVDRYAPGFRSSVVGRQVLSPLDLERVFGLTGGDIFHGAMTLDQIFSARPMLGYADYRGPVAGLYHCGAGAHPGGGVTGAPGHNAARAMIHDHHRHRWR